MRTQPQRQWVRWTPRKGQPAIRIGELVGTDYDTQMGTVRRLGQNLEVPLSMLVPVGVK